MANQPKSSRVLHIILWVVQAALAATLMWAGFMKLLQPVEKLAAMWPWAGQVPVVLVKLTGIVDVAGAAGLILPALFFRGSKLTFNAAICLIVLMLCASIFHVARGEVSQIGVNLVVAGMAAFVAWGRFTKGPISQLERK